MKWRRFWRELEKARDQGVKWKIHEAKQATGSMNGMRRTRPMCDLAPHPSLKQSRPRLQKSGTQRRRAAKEKKQKLKIGCANFQKTLDLPGVDHLSFLPPEWRDELVPRDSKEGKRLFEEMNEIELELKESGFLSDKLYSKFQKVLAEAREFFARRIRMYEKTLKGNEAALCQICTLINSLDDMYRQSYENIFETQIAIGEEEGFKAWVKWATKTQKKLKKNSTGRLTNTTSVLPKLYAEAVKVMPRYEEIGNEIAQKTGATFTMGPLKHIFRALEKTAFRHDEALRWKCDNVYDLVRGALQYDDMHGITAGGKGVCDHPDFVTGRMKDRFSNPTSAKWRDCMINGHIKLKNNFDEHKLEIQIHHKKMVMIRESMGGHYIYAIFRALVEALEVVYGGDVFELIQEKGKQKRGKKKKKKKRKSSSKVIPIVDPVQTYTHPLAKRNNDRDSGCVQLRMADTLNDE